MIVFFLSIISFDYFYILNKPFDRKKNNDEDFLNGNHLVEKFKI